MSSIFHKVITMNEDSPNIFQRLKPYYAYLLNVKWTFLTGVLAGILYGISSGAGIPLVTKYIFPILFQSSDSPQELIGNPFDNAPSYLQGILAPLQALLLPIFESIDEGYLSLSKLPQHQFLLITCAFLPATFLLRAIGGYFNHYLINAAGLKVLEQIRIEIFNKLQILSLKYYHDHHTGEIVSRLQGSSSVLRSTMMVAINDIIVQPATLISAIAAIIFIAVTENGATPALLGIAGIPLAILPIRVFGKKIKKKAKTAQLQTEDLSNTILQNVQSPLVVRAFNLQDKHSESFRDKTARVLANMLKVEMYSRMIGPIIEVLAVLGLSGAIYLGVSGGMTLETFTALATALYIAYEPVKKLGKLNGTLQNGAVALDRLEGILHSEEIIPEPEHPENFREAVRGELVFKDAAFSYDGEEQTLAGISLKIQPGEVVALVGESGAGKTTFMNLIPRLYDLTEGEFLLDGINVKQLSKATLREQIALVPQMPTLFNVSIKENILLGRPSASEEDLVKAASYAHAHEFIASLPQGYDTILSEGGASLSGGQRQRIAIARAFLKDAPILMLDEATSALDNESEAKVTEALDHLMQGKTTLMIAHRESSLKSATRRLSFEKGRLIKDEQL